MICGHGVQRNIQRWRWNQFRDAVIVLARCSGHDSLAGRRLTQMRDFYAFLLSEIPALLNRWHHQSLPASRRT